MKSKMLIAVLFVGLVSQRWAMSQTHTNSVTTTKPAMSEAAPADQPTDSTPNAETAGAATNTATLPATGTEMSPGSSGSNESAGATATSIGSTNETAAASTNSPAAPVRVMPIQFQDVPLTTAIENLARLANINYLLDPKIKYGQPGPNGQIVPEPTVSVRWENVTARQALLALLDNYNLQLVEDPRSRIARITIRNPNAAPPLETRVIQLKYASVSNMEAAVSATLTDKRSRVMGDTRTSQLIVVATDREQEAVDTLVAQLDKPTRQVLIETRFMEVSSTPSTSKGIDWSGTLSAQNIAFGNDALPGIPPTAASTTVSATGAISTTPASQGVIGGVLNNPLLLGSTATKGFFQSPFFLNADGVKAVLSFLNQDADAQVIATPRVVTLDNQPAHIEVTRAQPIFNTTAGTQGSPGGSQVAYTNLGTILDVTPRISANNYIWLTVSPEVSDDAGTVTRIVAGVENQADFYDVRKVTTQVLIPNANTLVMGGFIKDNTINGYTKVPILGDIPILGYAFRSENKELQKDNLIIFITPTIVQDGDFQPTTTSFLHSSPMEPESPMNPQSAWSSAKPYDWSNPKETDRYYNAASPPPFDTATSTNNPAESSATPSSATPGAGTPASGTSGNP